MARVDLFCVPEDRHRVILLADLLEKAGQSLRLRTEPTALPSDPLLVVSTAAALRHDWLVALLQSDQQVVAIRLDNAPLPGRCAAVVDLQSWPARSADAKVGGLVRLLQAPGAGEPPDSRSRVRVRAAPPKPAASRNSWTGGLVAGGLLLLTGMVLWALVPDSETSGQSEITRTAPELPRAAPERPRPTPEPPRAAPEPSRATPEPPSATRERMMTPPDIAQDGPPTAAAAPGTSSPAASSSAPPAAAASGNDSISRLCQAHSLQAALAWAGVLDWRQRNRLDEEPCVARLLQKPGFGPLRKALSVS